MKPIKCFLVDDDPDDQDFFKYSLQKLDVPFELFVADDGIHAMDMLKDAQFIPDIIFIDLNMPRLNGLECIMEIKKIERLADVPLYIYSTAHAYQNDINIKQLGVKAYIEKPNDVMELTPILKRIFEDNRFKQ